MAATKSTSTDRTTLSVLKEIGRRMVTGPRQKRRVTVGIVCEAVGIALGLAGPLCLQRLVDGLTRKDMSAIVVVAYVAAFALAMAGTSVCAAVRVVFSTRVIDDMTGHVVTEALRARLPAAATARDGDSGRMLGLIERLPYSLLIVADGLIWRAVPLIVQLGLCLAVVGGVAPLRYVAALAIFAGVYVLVTRLGGRQHQGLSNQTNAAIADVSQNTGDVLRNARRVVLNGALDVELAGIETGYERRAGANQQVAWSLVRLTAYQYGSLGLGLIVLLWMGGLDVRAGHLTVGDFVLLQAFALRLILPLSGFAFVLSQAAVAMGNIRDVLDLIAAPEGARSPVLADGKAAAIRLTDLAFSYGPGLPGLVEVTAEIRPGAFTVIVGPNGSGKSTLAQLMAGLLEPSEGRITINGQNLQDIPRRDRHGYVLYVPQFIGLFNRSLGANALYPPTTQTEDDLARLLNQWHFYEAGRDIDFGAPVGEQGERLSGGQIQKLELARIAGVSVPAIILDESTSALDPASEVAVISELRYRFGLRTTLVMITHHHQMAEAADQVLFVRGGRLVDAGSHAELCRRSPAYLSLWGES